MGMNLMYGSQAARDVLDERRRQINAEGWSSEHDNGALVRAAICYAAPLQFPARMAASGVKVPEPWPWEASWWRPKNERRNLIKAAALLIAEIERLDRRTTGSGHG